MRAEIIDNCAPGADRRYQVRILDDNGDVARLRGEYRYLGAALEIIEDAGVLLSEITLNGVTYVVD